MGSRRAEQGIPVEGCVLVRHKNRDNSSREQKSQSPTNSRCCKLTNQPCISCVLRGCHRTCAFPYTSKGYCSWPLHKPRSTHNLTDTHSDLGPHPFCTVPDSVSGPSARPERVRWNHDCVPSRRPLLACWSASVLAHAAVRAVDGVLGLKACDFRPAKLTQLAQCT